MKTIKFISALLLAGSLLAGCASVAHIEKDENVNFADYKTFAWIDTKDKNGNDLTEQNVRKAVNAELAKEGWR